MCRDYGAVNRWAMTDNYHLPKIETLDWMGRAKIFTKLDLASRCHRIAIADDLIYITGVTTHLVQLDFVDMPFGSCSGPTMIQGGGLCGPSPGRPPVNEQIGA